jgi:hypothetical protein
MTRKTSWTDSQLEQLCKPYNHKIEFDGYQYRWLHNIDGVWKIHCIKLYEDENSLNSNKQLWLNWWKEEFNNRYNRNLILHYKKSKTELQNTKEIYRIARSNLKTKIKIEQLKNINPNISTKELCNLLEKEKGIICRYNREINNKSTLLSA